MKTEPICAAATATSLMHLPGWAARFAAKQTALLDSAPHLLWVGDSITHNREHAGLQPWRRYRPLWQHYDGDRRAVNLGFAGDATCHLLWRLQNWRFAGATAAVLLIGTNNLHPSRRWSADETEAGIVACVDALQSALPGIGVLLIGVPPNMWRGAEPKRLAVNQALSRRYAGAAGILFQDVSDLFMRDGAIDADAFADTREDPPLPGVHPTSETLGRVARAIEPALSGLLGDGPRI